MKITKIGYNPTYQINQNKNNQKSTPAFEGKIIGYTYDAENIPQLWKNVANVVSYIQSRTNRMLNLTSGTGEPKKFSAIMTFDHSFDNEAKTLVETLNAESAIKNLHIHFKFKDVPLPN